MKKFLSIFAIIVLMSFLLAGCQTAQTVQQSVTTTTKEVTKKMTSKVKVLLYDIDEKLYGQVPEENRAGIGKAEKALMEENEKLKLAELKVKKAGLWEDYYSYEMDIAKKNRDIAQAELNRLKWEAIDRSDLGKKDENQENIANLKEKKVELENDIKELQGDMRAVKSKIDSLEREIDFLGKRIGK